jgi:hypothetical protein
VVDDDLQAHHQLSIPEEAVLKKDVAADILLIFTDRVDVKFIKEEDNTISELRGRWCSVCM